MAGSGRRDKREYFFVPTVKTDGNKYSEPDSLQHPKTVRRFAASSQSFLPQYGAEYR